MGKDKTGSRNHFYYKQLQNSVSIVPKEKTTKSSAFVARAEKSRQGSSGNARKGSNLFLVYKKDGGHC